MIKIYRSLLLFIIIFNYSCEQPCGECFTPPELFIFEIADKTSGENLFTKGIYKASEIEVIDLSDSSRVDYSFIDEDDINLIQIHTIGWKTETVNYSINISNKNIFNLYVDAERISEDCCSYTEFHEIKIENTEYEFNQETGIYKILIEL